MKVLVADKFEQSGQDGLCAAGCEVIFQPDLKDDALTAAIAANKPDALIVRSTKVSAEMLAAGPLKLVVRAGAGYNTIDVAAASRLGIYVANCPGKNSVAVAELAFGLILALDRRLADNVIALRAGQWNKKEFSQARGLYGRTLGLIGVGRIGQEMIARARAFGMPVVAWSRSLTPEKAAVLGVTAKASMLEVAQTSDIVSVHVALNADTRGCLNAEFFKAMREGAYFINTARGEIVDQDALIDAMQTRRIRAGLDVFVDEPAGGVAAFANAIKDQPNLYGTHHIGASTDQAQEAIAAETVRIIKAFAETGRVPNVVNLAQRTPATHTLVARHLDRPGVLASVLDAISAANINVQEMENIVFVGSQAAVARINLDTAPAPATLAAIQAGNKNIIELSLLKL